MFKNEVRETEVSGLAWTNIGQTSHKEMFSFKHCRKGGETHARICLTLFPPCNCPLYHDINIMLCVYLLVIFNTKIIKSTKIMITIITHIIVVIIFTSFCNKR